MDARKDRDEGFTLLEAVVAMVIFGIIAASTAAVLVRAVGGASDNRARVAAAGVAAQTMDDIRKTASQAVGYKALSTAKLDPVTVQGRTYQVFVSVAPVTGTNSGSPCTTGGITDQRFKKVGIAVTWANSGTVQPVRTDTIVQNPGVAADPTKGALGVIVSGPSTAQSQVTVTLNNGSTALTDDAGCAYFDSLTPGTYRATASRNGWVDEAGNATSVSPQAGVQAAKATTVQLAYAQAATATLRYGPVVDGAVDTSYTFPGSTPFTLTGGTAQSYGASTSSATVTDLLYPYTAGYTTWLGTCAGSAPTSPVNFAAEAGTTPSVDVATGGLTISNSRIAPITVTLSQGLGCSTTYSVTVPASKSVKLVMPFGTWTVSTGLLGLSSQSATMTSASPLAGVTF